MQRPPDAESSKTRHADAEELAVPFGGPPEPMTPIQFELLVRDSIELESSSETKATITHREILDGTDCRFEMDIAVRFRRFGGEFLILVECKQTGRRVSRDDVILLAQKVRSGRAQKGMLYSTSGFQRGALRFAREHAITLVQVVDGRTSYLTRSRDDRGDPHSEALPPVAWVVSLGDNDLLSVARLPYAWVHPEDCL